MSVTVLWTTRDWARAIADLPADGPLPCRTALVPRGRVAHALRRELIRPDRADALAGTRFVSVGVAAADVLRVAGVHAAPGEDALRRVRVLRLLKSGLPLEHFPLELLRTTLGWDEAFARTISDLEAAGLTPEDVDAAARGDRRLRDVATVWRALDASAGASWSHPRILSEAARVLEGEPARWPYPGAVLAAAGAGTSAAEARFLRAIPRVTIGLLAARPRRPHYMQRMAALFGDAASAALDAATVPRSGESERAILTSYLFEPPAVLADGARARSAGPDGTVDIEEHAGLESELEAAADWVARQVLDGTPLEDIAVLAPAIDPLAGLLVERLSRLPWPDGTLPVHVAGGLPFGGTATGARTLAVVRALRGHLSAERLAAVLPSLRTMPAGARHLSHGAATDLAWSLGTVGGNPAHPHGALEWVPRMRDVEGSLDRQLERARAAADDPERAGLARKARDLERLVGDLRAIRPAVEALAGVAGLVSAGAPLAQIWPRLREFLELWLLQPGRGPRAEDLLDERLASLAADPTCGGLAADEALRAIEDVAAAMRLPLGRFGEPAVYVGTVREAAGVPFRAVRVIGLAEGHLPPVPREDPVIPDAVRARLLAAVAGGAAIGPANAGDRTIEALHALDGAIRNAGARVALSFSRLDADRSMREPASVILEAAAALGRPNAVTRAPGAVIPDGAALARDAFRPARARALEHRRRMPLGEGAWQSGVALGAFGAPPHWRGAGAIDLDRLAALRAQGEPSPLDGILGPLAAAAMVPGLAPERPISASALRDLLQCPHLFLLGTVLGLDDPASAPSQRDIGQPAYGALVHLLAQEFYQVHGASFCARDGAIEAWREEANAIVERVFSEFLEQYPLAGGAVRDVERERVRRDFHELLSYDWEHAGGRFVSTERTFGRPIPLELPLAGRSLFVRGQIDRIDADEGVTLIRDWKTGRAQPRTGAQAEPMPVLDVQLAVYALVAERLAAEWGLPSRVAAAYAYINRGADERSWRDDFRSTLAPAALEWLGVAGDLLAARAFPRTPDSADCTYCRFRPVCADPHDRARRVLEGGDAVLRRFAALKQGADEE